MGEIPFTFVNYDRISDNLLWLGYNGNGESVTLKFAVDLVKLDPNNNERHFHLESKYYSKKFERYCQSITRSYSCYYTLNMGRDSLGCMFRPSDVQILNMLIESNILPWFIGENRIFSMKDDRMVINGDYTEVFLPLNDRSYMKFRPVIINYENLDSYKEGIRIEVNSPDSCVDITIDKFMEFVYILKNTDMINLAATMINYVKIPPYNVNLLSGGNNNSGKTKMGNFFDK